MIAYTWKKLVGKVLPVICGLLLSVSYGNAAESDRRLQTLLLLGLSENLGLQAVKMDTLQAEQEVVAQDARFDPELFAEAGHDSGRTPTADVSLGTSLDSDVSRAEVGIRKSFTTGMETSLSLASERVEDDFGDLDPRYSSYLLLNLNQPLLRDFGTDINTTDLQISRKQELQSKYVYFKQAQDLALVIELVYYDLIRARQTELLREESRQLVVDLLAGNRSRLEAGVVPVTEVQEAETALADRDLQLALARQEREQIAHRLNGLLNNRISDPLERSARLDDVPLQRPAAAPLFQEIYSTALTKRPDLQAVILEQQSRGLRSDYFDNQTKPNLDMVVSLGLSGLSGDERDSSVPVYHSGSYFNSYDSMADGDGYQWAAGFVFSYPLGNREAQARAGQAHLAERQAGYRKQELELAIETELKQRLTELKRTGERFGIAERFEALANTTLKQENRRLGEGLSDSFRILTFQGVLIDAKIDRLTALIEYNKSLARYYLALGNNLERHGIVARTEEKEIRFENM